MRAGFRYIWNCLLWKWKGSDVAIKRIKASCYSEWCQRQAMHPSKKHLVMSIEDGIQKLSENCKVSKERFEEKFLNILNPRNKTMKVDAR